MRTFSLVLLGLAVGGGTAQPQPQPPRPNAPGACGCYPDAG